MGGFNASSVGRYSVLWLWEELWVSVVLRLEARSYPSLYRCRSVQGSCDVAGKVKHP